MIKEYLLPSRFHCPECGGDTAYAAIMADQSGASTVLFILSSKVLAPPSRLHFSTYLRCPRSPEARIVKII